ncbi:hypothetical protein GUJ93_ZPchr0013g34666 [Zizania palustris]|uniref:PHD-type zinc finger plants domain-containing protein n=1 Tax=Zizania palustris TaxID=103762 RepID=A0A8J6BUX2_ZIZPA|nr:hypothetical protein GUJ93_ZPchr0013g34666 [Zizania palustris]
MQPWPQQEDDKIKGERLASTRLPPPSSRFFSSQTIFEFADSRSNKPAPLRSDPVPSRRSTSCSHFTNPPDSFIDRSTRPSMMGSDKPAASASAGAGPSISTPAQPPAAVCCMCGDRGLLPELFRCAACAVRSQHTYCTERYPKAESYGTCNWCLLMRADQGSGGGAVTSSSARHSTVRAAGDHQAGGGKPAVPAKVASRGNFAAHLSKPIKKPPPPQRRILLRRSASDLGSRLRDAPPSPGVARGRPRVRRYKLLEEVITTN